METKLNRRRLLKTGVIALLGGAAQPFTGIPALAAYAVQPTLRRNAFTMAENDPILKGYRTAIAAMKALPANNPCSWTYQAAIHGTTVTPTQIAWNTCHTDSRFFWSWHRMYLYWFERIVRKHSGMYDWALPYWDWANPAQRQLPPAFRTAGSALHDPSRNAAMNDGTGSIATSFGTAVADANVLLDYYNSQSAINGPHGGIHGAVAGNMCCVISAAQDPIFWLHHANVDRQWNLWLAQGGGRSNPIADAVWRNTSFTFFDECCVQVKMTGCEVLRAAKQLSYAYECEPPQVEQYCPRTWSPRIVDIESILRLRKQFTLSKQSVSVPIYNEGADIKVLGAKLVEIAEAPGKTAVLQVKGVEAESDPGASWEVYVGPAGFKPNPKSPYFVGVLTLFGAGLKTRKEHYHPAEFTYPIDTAILGAGGEATLQVTFVPISGVEVGGRPQPAQVRADVTIAEIGIVVDVAMPQPPKDEQQKLRRDEELN
jgi:tyrosinase